MLARRTVDIAQGVQARNTAAMYFSGKPFAGMVRSCMRVMSASARLGFPCPTSRAWRTQTNKCKPANLKSAQVIKKLARDALLRLAAFFQYFFEHGTSTFFIAHVLVGSCQIQFGIHGITAEFRFIRNDVSIAV